MAVGNHRVADIAVGNRAVVAADTSVVEVVVAAAPVVGSPYSRSSLDPSYISRIRFKPLLMCSIDSICELMLFNWIS